MAYLAASWPSGVKKTLSGSGWMTVPAKTSFTSVPRMKPAS
jgi:hypothetical protein